ncbi:cation acetate symporter [Streptomyces sp. JJ36]|uniref:sodium/solute symporter n=1 Tax=Streptomyces sp. JJ36 TaxID=2736645 RepID=UPI001F1C2CAE|nr:cation acetate symporter [Streptomyces sp. JJ36]MCF6525704.1 cation acetate symporter [Streptomyces sp. JJ36]
MTSTALDGRTLALVVFAAFVTVSLLLCGLAAADQDEAEEFYAGNRSLGPAQNGLAVAGDYLSVATVLSTTGTVALVGADGVLFACATVGSLVLLMAGYAGRLRGTGRYTLADTLALRLRERPVRIALGVTAVLVLLPLLMVQLSAAGRIMAVMLDLPSGSLTGCTVLTGVLIVLYSAIGGMRGTGFIQILKTAVVAAAVLLLAGLVLNRFGWNPARLLDAAGDGSGGGSSYFRPGGQFGHSAAGWLDLLGFQVTLVLGAACMPHVTMRLYAVRSARALRASMRWAVGAVAVVCAGVVVIGLGASALVGGTALRAGSPEGTDALLMVTAVLDPAAGGTEHSVLFAFVACAVFATALAAVAGITLAAASSLAHDLLPVLTRAGRRSTAREVVQARGAVVLVGVVAVALAVLTQERNPSVLFSFSFAVAASTLFPVVLLTVFWRGFTTRGLVWTVTGTLPLVTVLMVYSPAVSGSPVALFPGHDFQWFPLQTPGLVTIPAGFALAVLGSRPRSREPRPGPAPQAPAAPPHPSPVPPPPSGPPYVPPQGEPPAAPAYGPGPGRTPGGGFRS